MCDLIPRLKPQLPRRARLEHRRCPLQPVLPPITPTCSATSTTSSRRTTPGAASRTREFFEYAHRFAEAEPGECLFIDDLPANVAAADEFGWKGVVYRADGTLADKLRAAGVEIGKTGRRAMSRPVVRSR